jgi:hypothetical protein
MITRLLSYLFCLYLTLSVPLAYAIDPITGAWTANAAASAAFGGGATGGAAALTAAVEAAAGAAATAATAAGAAALVAGAGVAAYCATSWAIGSNGCGSNPFGASTGIPGALSGAGITIDPQTGNLIKSGPVYFSQTPYSGFPGQSICFRSSPAAVVTCVKSMIQANYSSYVISLTLESSESNCRLPASPDAVLCQSYSVARAPSTSPNSFSSLPSSVPVYGQTGDSVATDAEVAAAVAANAKARAAAAAATAAPSITAADAAAAAATAAPRTAEAECAAKGMKHGTFNGAVFCVGTGAGIDGTGAPAGETGTDAGAGTGTGTSNPPNTGTSNPPVSPPMPAFCTYAQSLCEWLNWTKAEATFDTNTKPVIAEADDSISPSDYQRRYFEFGNACPPAHTIPISFMGASQTIQLSYDPLCMMAQKMRPVIILVAWIVGARIVVGSPAKGES